MKKIVLGVALALASTGAMAHEIEVSVTNFDTKKNIAVGLSGSGWGVQLDAATAHAGSIGVDASCGCDMDVDVTRFTTKKNIALGDASAGSITVSSSAAPRRGPGPRP